MTEAEAKTKLCPMYQGWTHISENHIGDRAFKCKGSDCMMWRRTDYGKDRGIEDGFCGLAGNPSAVAA